MNSLKLKQLLRRISVSVPSIAGQAFENGQKAPEQHDSQCEQSFRAAPLITEDQPGFHRILDMLADNRKFAFCKINHGFWERLARLEDSGVPRDAFITHPGDDIDERLEIK